MTDVIEYLSSQGVQVMEVSGGFRPKQGQSKRAKHTLSPSPSAVVK